MIGFNDNVANRGRLNRNVAKMIRFNQDVANRVGLNRNLIIEIKILTYLAHVDFIYTG